MGIQVASRFAVDGHWLGSGHDGIQQRVLLVGGQGREMQGNLPRQGESLGGKWALAESGEQ